MAKVLASQNPPGGLNVENVPQFVNFTFDDNGKSGLYGSGTVGGMQFILNLFSQYKNPKAKDGKANNPKTFDESPVQGSFYCAGFYAGEESQWENGHFVKKVWKLTYDEGHEIGNHTWRHPHGNNENFSVSDWEAEIQKCNDILTADYNPDEKPETRDDKNGIGINKKDIVGFRSPFLGYNDALFTALRNTGFKYDCSVSEGLQADQDGKNFLWPYTLDEGSPGDALTASENNRAPIGRHPGLWEIPTHVLIAPPDEVCEKYGCKKGLRAKLKKLDPSFNEKNGKVPGLDWNLWSPLEMSKEEFVATYKYSLDLRLEGNRAPLCVCFHSDIYADGYDDPMPNASAEDRRNAFKACLEYTLSIPETRTITTANLVKWLEEPTAL